MLDREPLTKFTNILVFKWAFVIFYDIFCNSISTDQIIQDKLGYLFPYDVS